MKHLEIKFEDLKTGDKLWDIRFGEVTVIDLKYTNEADYPIICNTGSGWDESYTTKGLYYHSHEFPVLFKSNPFEQVNEFPKLMEVYENSKWTKQVVIFIGIDYVLYTNLDNVEQFKNTKSSAIYIKRSISLHDFREINDVVITELTIEQIAERFSLPVEQIRIKK